MLKIGIFGVGHLGRIHAKLIDSLNDKFEFVGFYDPEDVNAQKVIDDFNIKRFTDIDELLDAVDCVDIVTPTIYHFKIAEAAIKKGKHVFIEKPITETVEEGQALKALADKHNVKVQVGHVERFNPAYKEAAPFLNAPLFIESHRLAFYNPRGTDVPVVLDLMIHDLDVILSCVKAEVKKVSASGVAVVSETPDITNARIEFENGCVANLTASRISLKNMRKTRFFQKDAYISVDFLEKTSEIVKMTTLDEEPDPFDIVFDLGEGKEKKKIEIFKPEVEASNAIQEELASFAEAIENDSVPPVTLNDGLKALEVAHWIMDEVKLSRSLIQENI
ncbi:Gfo/Idh/MocA family oxidoreductase [Paracrocinitomix mangrovi]|uniref:Gfo/Idh/MocA family protein n=1 Tax=Paracrocinitomix mangrovi TaxID=2862509 RepID=UPI001C8E4543|nr:Gfo/Idh/MocA family oxidoreductase [Paracrocinitomix mangrovi]UKN02061.1 Gfo/Idh/MocA family oxidoreductase [Paracrocinitomix mangrovi]